MRLSKRGGTTNWATSFDETVPDIHPMEQAEFQALCINLGITDSRIAAELFGRSWRSCQRYWYGELAIPGPLARYLRLAAGKQLTLAELRALAGPAPR